MLPLEPSPSGLPSEGSTGSPASSSRGEPLAVLSPGKARKLGSDILKPPRMSGVLQKLPPLSELQVHTLLQWHAQTVLDTELFQPQLKRVRLRGKHRPPERDLIERLAADASVPAGPPRSWEERRRASQFVANVLAHYTGDSVRRCREQSARMWKAADLVVKANAYVLMEIAGAPGPSGAVDPELKEPRRMILGGLLTWQSAHGRGADRVNGMFRMGLSVTQVSEACELDSSLQAEFKAFSTWISAKVEHCGLDLWTCCMELNTEEAATNRLHFHAFVCLHWKKWKQGPDVFAPIEYIPSDWLWQGFHPHMTAARLRGHQNPYKTFGQALYYEAAPKIGSIFRAGNVTVFKEPRAYRFDESPCSRQESCRNL